MLDESALDKCLDKLSEKAAGYMLFAFGIGGAMGFCLGFGVGCLVSLIRHR